MDHAMIDPIIQPSYPPRFTVSFWLKIGVSGAVIFLLLYFKRFDYQTFSELIETWPWLTGAVILMLPPFILVSYRFKLILASQGFDVPTRLAVRWTMIGLFFDLAMPSSNGGDVVKAGYVMTYAGIGRRTGGIMAVAFDRVIGLLGLFLLVSTTSILRWDEIKDLPSGNSLAALAFLTSLGALAFFRVAGSRRLCRHPIVEQRLNRYRWGRHLNSLIRSFNALREQPKLLVGSLGLSMLNHVFWCASLLCITEALGHRVDPIKGFVVFPFAIFSNVFGIAGGFGLGTAGFDLLLSEFLGIGDGALIGFIFQSLSALLRLAGLPFYLSSPPESSIHEDKG